MKTPCAPFPWLIFTVALGGCGAGGAVPPESGTQGLSAPGASAPAKPGASAPAKPGASAPAASSGAAKVTSPKGPKPQPERCGEHRCYHFKSMAQAGEHLLALQPQIIAFGEAHAQLAHAGLTPTVVRFQQQLLPLLAKSGASELVVELLRPAPNCQEPTKEVKKVEKQVTRTQSKQNKNHYVELGHASNALGIVPFILEPSCEVYRSIAEAGEQRLGRMLEVIAEQTAQRLSHFWQRQQQQPSPKVVLAYGGAMHNDIVTRAGTESWSFGAPLVKFTGGRYLEVDLVAPEQIGDSAAWQRQPWYASFDAAQPQADFTLIQLGEFSYVLFFPHAPKAKL